MIKRTSIEVLQQSRQMTARITKDSVRFSVGVVAAAGMAPGKFLQFDELSPGQWVFIVNDDPDGFPARAYSTSGQMQVGSRGLIQLISKSISHKLPATFYVQQMDGVELEGHRVYGLLLYKPVDQTGV